MSSAFGNELNPKARLDKLKARLKNETKGNLLKQKSRGAKNISKDDAKNAGSNSKNKLKNEFAKISAEYKALADALSVGEGKLTERRVKDLLKASTPTINPYAESSLVQDISFSKSKVKGLEEVNAFDKNSTSGCARVPSPDDNPVLNTTGQLKVKMLGNFYIKAGQQYYFDLDTGTELDNIYSIGSVNHSIGDSGIETSFTAVRSKAKYNKIVELFGKHDENSKLIEAGADKLFDGIITEVTKEVNEQRKKEAAKRAQRASAYKAAQARKKAAEEIAQQEGAGVTGYYPVPGQPGVVAYREYGKDGTLKKATPMKQVTVRRTKEQRKELAIAEFGDARNWQDIEEYYVHFVGL